jgi:2'-5' RNA ligase superfamily
MSTMQRMVDHWWWRPGWRVGRRMLAWHFTFADQPEVRRLATEYHTRLAGLAGLDLVPERWLHLTTQALGFADEVPDDTVDMVIEATRLRLATTPPPTVTVGPAVVLTEGPQLTVHPTGALDAVRRALREAITAVRGPHLLLEADEWRPHISLAYSNSDGPRQPVITALTPQTPPATVTLHQIQLICLGRDKRLYEWETRESVPLSA